MNKKVILVALLLVSTNVSAATIDQRLNTVENKVNYLDQDLMTVNNDSVIRDLNLQKQINELKQSGYDDKEIKDALEKHDASIIAQEAMHSEHCNNINSLRNDLSNLRNETRKGISQAIAIAGLERPTYDSDHKLSVMFGTGTYKATTSVAYGVSYMPNYDTVFSIKGSNDSVACSVGVNL